MVIDGDRLQSAGNLWVICWYAYTQVFVAKVQEARVQQAAKNRIKN